MIKIVILLFISATFAIQEGNLCQLQETYDDAYENFLNVPICDGNDTSSVEVYACGFTSSFVNPETDETYNPEPGEVWLVQEDTDYKQFTPSGSVNNTQNGPHIHCTRLGSTESKLCDESCIQNGTGVLACNGSANYCNSSWVTCSMTFSCYCYFWNSSVNIGYSVHEELSGNLLDPATCETKTLQRYDLSELDTRDAVNPTIHLKLDDNVLKVYLSKKEDYMIMMSKDDFSFSDRFTDDYYELDLPIKARIISGDLQVWIIDTTGNTYSETIWIPGLKSCNLVDCVICVDSFRNFDCMPRTMKFFFVLVMILIVAAALLVFPGLIWAVVFLLKLMKLILIWSYNLFKSLLMRTKKPFTRLYNAVDSQPAKTEIQMEEAKEFNPNITVVKGRQPGRSGLNPTYSFLLITLVGLSMACDYGAVIDTEEIDCRRGYCLLSEELSFTLRHPNEVFCFTIVEGDAVVGSLNITFISMEYHLLNTFQYYSSSWDLVSENNKRCAWTDHCNDDDCSGLDPAEDINAYGELNQHTVLEWPGVTSCHRVSGGVNNNCFSTTDACVFSRASLAPKFPQVKVSLTNDILAVPTLQVSYSFNNGTFTYSTKPLQTECMSIGCFEIEDYTSFDLPELSKKWVSGPAGVSYMSAADLNEPVEGVCGDIQTSDPIYFVLGNPSGFEYSSDLIKIESVGEKSVSYASKSAGCDFYMTNKKLPQKVANLNCLAPHPDDDSIIVCQPDFPVSISGSLTFNETFNFTRTISVVCPDVEFEETTGCESCDTGAFLQIKIKSSCEAGSVLLSSNDVDLVTRSLEITTEKQLLGIYYKVGVKRGSATINFEGSGSTSEFTFNYELAEENMVEKPVDQFVDANDNQNEPSPENSWWHPARWFSELGSSIDAFFRGQLSWWKELIWSVVLVVLSLLFVLVIVKILMTVNSRRSASKKKV